MTTDPLHPGSTPAEPDSPQTPGGTLVPPPAETPAEVPPEVPAAAPGRPAVTRAGMVWAATATALLLLVLLIIFIAQNQEPVRLQYFGLVGSLQLGLALLIAAVGGGILVAAAGAARIIQLRANARRARPPRPGRLSRRRA